MKSPAKFKAVVIGVSAGGMNALPKVLAPLPQNFPAPIIVVQHIHPDGDDGFFVRYLNEKCLLEVTEPHEKEPVGTGHVYLAPADHHLIIKKNKTFSLSSAKKVNFSRPSIDVLFESAADVYRSELIGIILTGASTDGANGMKKIKDSGGITIIQDPAEAETAVMPLAAAQACEIDYVLPLEGISETLMGLLKTYPE